MITKALIFTVDPTKETDFIRWAVEWTGDPIAEANGFDDFGSIVDWSRALLLYNAVLDNFEKHGDLPKYYAETIVKIRIA